MTGVSYVICTRDRPRELGDTIARLDALHRAAPEPAELVIADNASAVPVRERLPPSALPVRVVRLEQNLAAAARNHAARAARHEWLVMLDDDSAPLDLGHLEALASARAGTAVVMADIFLPDGTRERGGLPEVLVGCGAAIRRRAFLGVGGYDPAFLYMAEEPDLCARLIAAGWGIEFSPRFRVLHHKTATNRDMDRVLRLLTRNQGVVIERTTPRSDRALLRGEHIRRCAWIARKEDALRGFALGLADLRALRASLERRPLRTGHYERFTGLLHARKAIARAMARAPFATACLTHEGKHAWAVRRALAGAQVRIVRERASADRLVIATLSPGPMLDALAQLRRAGEGARAIAPWDHAGEALTTSAGAAPARTPIGA